MRFQSRYFFWCLKNSLRRIRKQTDLLDLASNEKNTGSTALPVAVCPGFYLSNAKMSWTPPTICSFSQNWRIGSSAGPRGRVQTTYAHWSVYHQGQENLVMPVKKSLYVYFCNEGDAYKVNLSLQMWQSRCIFSEKSLTLFVQGNETYELCFVKIFWRILTTGIYTGSPYLSLTLLVKSYQPYLSFGSIDSIWEVPAQF